MVTQMNKASKNAAREMTPNPNGKGEISQETANFKSRMKDGNAIVDSAIKARTESFGTLTLAAATALLFYADFGRTELINRLFSGLLNAKTKSGTRDVNSGHTDANAFRSLYIPRIIEEFGVGGEKELDESGMATGKWIRRNTPFLQFMATPDDGHSFFIPANYKKGKEIDAEKQKHVQQAKANMVEAGLEGLQAVEWIKRADVVAPDREYGLKAFWADVTRVLSKAAKSGNVPASTILAISRDAGLEKADRAKIASVLAESQGAAPDKPDEKTQETGEKTEIPAEHPSQTQQAA